LLIYLQCAEETKALGVADVFVKNIALDLDLLLWGKGYEESAYFGERLCFAPYSAKVDRRKPLLFAASDIC